MSVEIQLKLNFRNKIPLSDQVQEEMRRLIQAGSLLPGDQLPTVRELAAQLKVNFNTIARAYRTLDQDGLISTQQGRGTFVMETESADEKPVPTKAEWAEQLVDDLFKKANHQEIRPELLIKAFRDRLKTDQIKIGRRTYAIRKRQLKRIFTPTGDRGWVNINTSPGLKKPRKKHKSE